MKYPDETVDYMKCPICNSYMNETNNSVCKIYFCREKDNYYRVDNVGYSHYEFIRYKSGEVLFHYFIPPIMIWSTKEQTEVYLNEKYSNSATYYSRQIAQITNPLFLVEDNVEDIKKKIKIYSLFI